MSFFRNFQPCLRQFRGLLLPLLLGAFPGPRAQSAVPTAKWVAGDGKGMAVVGVVPVAQPNAGNAALFMGVNEFEDQSLRALRFAVNDAVAQAHLFVLELRLIPPANTVVMLSGEPSTDLTRTQLAALKDAGVRVDRASRAKLLSELARAVAVPQEAADLVVVSLSSHGFEESGIPYVMPADGTRAFLADTGFKLKTVEDRLARAKAGKRLLIVDACREKATGDDKSLGTSMDQAWREALAQASGQAVLASCDVGQFSFEDVKLGHGVFTYYLLAALNGKATSDARGHITLGAVSDHVARSVNDWVLRNKVGSAAESAQKPWFKGPNDARDMPLAVSKAFLEGQREAAALAAQREAVALLAQRELLLRKKAAKERLADAYRAQNDLLGARLLVEIEGGLETLTGQPLEVLLSQVDELQNPTVTRVSNFVLWWKSVRAATSRIVPSSPDPAVSALPETTTQLPPIVAPPTLTVTPPPQSVTAPTPAVVAPTPVSIPTPPAATPPAPAVAVSTPTVTPPRPPVTAPTSAVVVPTPVSIPAPPAVTTIPGATMQLALRKPAPDPELAPPTSRPPPPFPAPRDRQFQNSLGMRFVLVPRTEVWFSVWETRVKDFQEYSASNPTVGSAWRNPFFKKEPVTPGPNHPVVNVTHRQAKEFCQWLTDKERREGSISASTLYRLPTDEEWSWAVGIGDKEAKGTPAEKSGRLKSVFPWGTQWPPPNGSANYTDSDAKAKFGTGLFGALTGVIAGYTDGYPTTAPVGSFPPNALGIFDLGGNVSEWCEEWQAGRTTFRVCRGGSWLSNDPMFINASSRFNFAKDLDSDDIGFRVVLQGLSR